MWKGADVADLRWVYRVQRLSFESLADELKVVVRTRNGRNLSANIPGLPAMADLAVVLDGELVARSGRASDFYSLGPLLATTRRHTVAVTFCAFDLLWLEGELLIDDSYEQRRLRLEKVELPSEIGVVPRFEGDDAADLLRACEANGVEGVVLKRLASRYSPGKRSREWRKVKVSTWRIEHLERRRPK